MRMRQWILIAMFASPTLWGGGCGKPKEVAAPVTTTTNLVVPAATAPWLLRAKELTAAIKKGMTEDEVMQVAGDPKMVKTNIGIESAATWQYDVGGGNWFNVQFDKSNRVASAALENTVKAQ